MNYVIPAAPGTEAKDPGTGKHRPVVAWVVEDPDEWGSSREALAVFAPADARFAATR